MKFPKETMDFLVEAGAYLTVNKPDVMKEILTKNLVPSLDGEGKMSKSKGHKKCIYIDDDLPTIRKKIAKIPTNPENWDILFELHWLIMNHQERDQLAGLIVKKILK